jgi:hypothetical protein
VNRAHARFVTLFFGSKEFPRGLIPAAPIRKLTGQTTTHSSMPRTAARVEMAAVLEIPALLAFHFVCGRSCAQARVIAL